MKCNACGTELPAEAHFCWHCGKPLSPEEAGYQYCELRLRELFMPRNFTMPGKAYWFEAYGSGPDGEQVYASSREFLQGRDQERLRVICRAELGERLLAAGWEALGDGKYRRPRAATA